MKPEGSPKWPSSHRASRELSISKICASWPVAVYRELFSTTSMEVQKRNGHFAKIVEPLTRSRFDQVKRLPCQRAICELESLVRTCPCRCFWHPWVICVSCIPVAKSLLPEQPAKLALE